jgi:tetratricopeptide (TPR) repeat protein
MSLADRHVEELKAALWRELPSVRARYEALRRSDAAGLVAAARRAVDDHDTRAVIAIGEMLQARGELTAKPFQRIRFVAALLPTLLEERRYAEALELLEHPDIANPGHHKYRTMKALALAGAGRLKDAHREAREALALAPRHGEAWELERALHAAIKLKRVVQAGEAGWRNLRRLAEAYLELDLSQQARPLLKRHLKPFPPIAEGERDDVLAVLKASLELLGPAAALGYARSARAGLGKDAGLRAIICQCLIDLGRPEEALGEDAGGRDLQLQRALALAACGQLDEAISRLGRLSEALREDLEVREALGWCVGEHVRREAPLVFGPPAASPRVVNLMPFNDELELLQMHLAEMSDWVDLFVIVESTVTFTGAEKPLHFERAKADFAAYAHKIRHVVVDGHPPAFQAPWSRDFRQRDMAVKALSGVCAPEDLVLLTDVDEIVDRRALEGFEGDSAGLRMAMFRFFLNYRPTADNLPWRRTGAVFRAGLLQRFGSSYARFCLARRKSGQVLREAGWHFTSIGDSRRVVAKINSYAHQERKAVWRDEDRVGRLFEAIRGGRPEHGWERAEIDDSFPRYVRENQDALKDLMI